MAVDSAQRQSRWINTPLFGRCKLIRHGMEEVPTCLLGYVEREHTGATLTIAINQDGVWKSRNLKGIPGKITAWYSMEREDGRPLF